MEQMFNENYTNEEKIWILREIADIFHTFIPTRGNEFLNRLRERDFVMAERLEREREGNLVRNNRLPRAPKKIAIHQDTQNVHNTEINNTVKKAAQKLYSLYKDRLIEIDLTFGEKNVKDYLIKKFPGSSGTIEVSITRIRTDTANFNINLNLEQIFKSLWLFIQEHKDKEEIEKILIEELARSKGFCSTGYLARLMSSIQGFTEDPDLTINISLREQCHTIITKYLTDSLRICTDGSIMDGMIDGTDEFKDFIRKRVSEKVSEWKKEYGEDFILYLPDVVNIFSHTEIYNLEKPLN